MPQTVEPSRTAAGLVPAQRTGTARPGVPAAGATTGGHLARAYAVARGLRALRPVPARAQEPYGESDGQ
ncbi:hypothetical protein AB0D08_04700 [Kitasatospora sp. NPDC048540]|uniref:hypothetical protein n=1 Tax=unclassified Kitasatospora TaxID=2633591 RepID=UPI00053ACF4F|nr:hypothetical protein [Kitasatospora sp. MBT63]